MIQLLTLGRLGLELKHNLFKDMLQNVFWIASASLPGVAPYGSNAWVSNNSNAFPDLWTSAITSPAVQNNKALIGMSKQGLVISSSTC